MSRKLKLTIASVLTTLVATMGVATAAASADEGAANAGVKSYCC